MPSTGVGATMGDCPKIDTATGPVRRGNKHLVVVVFDGGSNNYRHPHRIHKNCIKISIKSVPNCHKFKKKKNQIKSRPNPKQSKIKFHSRKSPHIRPNFQTEIKLSHNRKNFQISTKS